MAKVNKIFPSFYNGITEQPPEVSLDTQCQDMVNCIPDVVSGLTKRPPLNFVTSNQLLDAKVIHTYDRGEDDEEYIFYATNVDATPIAIYDKQGIEKTVTYDTPDVTELSNYLTGTNLKGLTVQDRTYIINKDIDVTIDATGSVAPDSGYALEAFYWLKRGSGDKYNPYNYAVYLDGITFETSPTIPETTNKTPPTGHELTTIAATALGVLINANADYNAIVIGSILKITRTNGADFTFNSWDSWGNQASEGWKGATSKLSDLPGDFPWEDTYVEIGGDDGNDFTTYYVKWNGSSWQETLNPAEIRGVLANMPIQIDRQSDGTFFVSLIDWEVPAVGSSDSNPDPTFVDSPVSDIFFYKNRLGLASTDSVVLSETGGYQNFYIQTVLDITATDPIDIAIASSKASKIYYVKPFQNSLFLFTKDSQFEMISEGATTPETVSINIISTYPMSVGVAPIVMNSSLFFISKTNNKQQLREYSKDESTLVTKGVDLSLVIPNLLSTEITGLVANGVLGYVFLTTATNLLYTYMYKDNGSERIQAAWSKWLLLEDFTADQFEYAILDSDLLIMCKTATDYIYHIMDLTKFEETSFIDTTIGDVEYQYKSYVKLPDWYPHLGTLGTPLDRILVKKVTIEGTGSFSSEVYRKDYNTTYSKTYTDTSILDKDIYVNSKVGKMDITLIDETENDFSIKSIVMEGLFTPSSKETK